MRKDPPRRFRRSIRSICAALALMTIPLATPSAHATAGEPQDVDAFAYLRQLTLDLWGRIPTYDEVAAVVGKAQLTEADVDALLDDDRFAAFIDRYHADLLLPFVDQFRLVNFAAAFLIPPAFADPSDPDSRVFTYYNSLYARGALVACADEPAEFNPDGSIVMKDRGDGVMLDGYVMVEPYWAPGTQVKVCALEARAEAVSPTGQDCASFGGISSGSCGCGPNLRYCASMESSARLVTSFREQMLRMLRVPAQSGGNYYDALRGRAEEVDGAIAHYYRYLTPMSVDPFILFSPVNVATLPDVPFTDTTWQTVQRDAPSHSGLLTSMVYLLRFQTARARASRFWDAFLCQPFQAPDTELPSPNEPCSDEPDLRLRCGCNGCHATLEPAAAYWSRFADAGTAYMTPLYFPISRDCSACGADPFCAYLCDRFYLTEPGHPKEEPWVGTLTQFVFRDDTEMANAESGPQGLVDTYLNSGHLASCTVSKVFTRLVNRPPTPEEKLGVIKDLAAAFADSGYDFKTLVRALVLSDHYRRLVR